jgi:hypothetical protein
VRRAAADRFHEVHRPRLASSVCRLVLSAWRSSHGWFEPTLAPCGAAAQGASPGRSNANGGTGGGSPGNTSAKNEPPWGHSRYVKYTPRPYGRGFLLEADGSSVASFGRLRQPKAHSLVQRGACASRLRDLLPSVYSAAADHPVERLVVPLAECPDGYGEQRSDDAESQWRGDHIPARRGILNRYVRQGTILRCPVQADGGAVA